jgi:hypothetical protein
MAELAAAGAEVKLDVVMARATTAMTSTDAEKRLVFISGLLDRSGWFGPIDEPSVARQRF